jgi:hypothetical protein
VYYGKHYLVFLVAAALASIPWKQTLSGSRLGSLGQRLKPLAVTALLLASLGLIISQSYNPFLYFRF